MKAISLLIGVAMATALVAWMVWPQLRVAQSEDPFRNAISVVTTESFARRHVPGRVIEYVTPPYFEIMPDIDWGEHSVYLETNFPIDPAIYGGSGDNLTVRCAQVAFTTIDDMDSLPGPVGWPPGLLFDIARNRANDEDYLRYCEIQVGMTAPNTDGFERLVQQCKASIEAVLPGGIDVDTYDSGGWAVASRKPISLLHGTFVQARCWRTGVMQHLHFELWFLADLSI